MALYIGALVVFLLFVGTIILIKKIDSIRPKAQAMLKKIMKQTFWNNTISSISISYFETTISLHVAVQASRQNGLVLAMLG